jgi:hypothetical protein
MTEMITAQMMLMESTGPFGCQEIYTLSWQTLREKGRRFVSLERRREFQFDVSHCNLAGRDTDSCDH